jgi:hypothetical protein
MQARKFKLRYDKLKSQLNSMGYRVVIIEDKSNSISRARCERVYSKLMQFFDNSGSQNLLIVS